MNKVTRNFDAILADLTTVENESGDHKVKVMAYALRWGYASLRCHHALESHLRHQPDLTAFVSTLAGLWDGQSYMSGALRTANTRTTRDFDADHNEVNHNDL